MQAEHTHDDHGQGHVHVTPFWPMLIVFVTLVVLTVVTVLTAKYVDIPGNGNLILAMFIACVKGLLVAGFFMHLVYDDKMNTVVLASCLFCVALFVGFSLLDLGSRDTVDRLQDGEIVAGGTSQVVQQAAEAAHAAEGNHDGDAHAADGAEGEHDAAAAQSDDGHTDEHADEEHPDEDH
jgi:cytochrome c oxidase subunit 4